MAATAESKAPIRLAMVGLGWWGRKMTDLTQAQAERVIVTRAVEPDLRAAEAFAAAHGIGLTSELADVLHDPDVDAVILATPHSLHEAQIELAVRAGKHVFCEKPLALTRAGAERAVRLCQDAGLVLGMGHERRFEPPMAELLAAAANGCLGRIVQVEANFSHDKFLTLAPDNWRLDPVHAPAGGMTATGIHLTDLAVALLGPAREVFTVCETLASTLPAGDTMSAYIRFQRGGTAYVSASLCYPFVSRFAVYGTEGWIDIRDRAHLEAPDGWIVTRGLKGQAMSVEHAPKSEAVLLNLEAFGRAVAGEAAYPITGAQLIDNIALLEAIVAGASSGRIEQVP